MEKESYRGYSIQQNKEGYYDVYKNKWSRYTPIQDNLPTVDEAKAWIDSDISDSEPKVIKGHIHTWNIEKNDDGFRVVSPEGKIKKTYKTGDGIANAVCRWEDDYFDTHPKARLANPDVWKDHYQPRNPYIDPYKQAFLLDSFYRDADSLITEDTEKIAANKWTNRGKDGTHGTFRTKKEADAQRRAMFANGYHEAYERNYGGAYDIEPDQYFTRDDLNDFAQNVADKLYKITDYSHSVISAFITNSLLELTISCRDIEEIYVKRIDFRTIKRPEDLNKYLDDAVKQLLDKFRKDGAYTDITEESIGSSHKAAIKEEATEMKNYELTYSDGPLSDRRTTVIVQAENIDDANQIAYSRPEAKRYENVIVAERVEGICVYMVVFVTKMFCDGEYCPRYNGEDRLGIAATSESEARQYYNKHFKNLYCASHVYNRKPVKEVPTVSQYIQLGDVKEVYQLRGANPDNYPNATITEDMNNRDIEYRVDGYRNRWSVIDTHRCNGKTYGLLENCVWGDETCYLVVDMSKVTSKTYHDNSGSNYTLPTFTEVVGETYDDLVSALQDFDLCECVSKMQEAQVTDYGVKINNKERQILNAICRKYCGWKLPKEISNLWNELEEHGVDVGIISGIPHNTSASGTKSWEQSFTMNGEPVVNSMFIYQVYEGSGDSLKNEYNIYFS